MNLAPDGQWRDDEVLVRSTANKEAEELNASYEDGSVMITRWGGDKQVFSNAGVFERTSDIDRADGGVLVKAASVGFVAPWDRW